MAPVVSWDLCVAIIRKVPDQGYPWRRRGSSRVVRGICPLQSLPLVHASSRLAPSISGDFGIRGNPLRPVTQISRNQPCSCGSGKRYKHCCGADPAPIAGAPGIEAPGGVAPVAGLPELMQRALTAQMEGKLEVAQALYREALQRAPANFDALHMLGVVRLQCGDPEEAVRHIVRAIRLGTVDYPPIYDNLVLCLQNIARRRGSLAELLDAAAPAPDAPRIRFAQDVAAFAAGPPLVSALLRCADDDVARFAPGLESLCRQTHRRLEFVLGTAGPGTRAFEGMAVLLADRAFALRHLPGEEAAAPPTLDACAAQARGRYVVALEPGDEYDADHIELLARLLEACGSRWGFSGVRFADAQGRRLRYGDDARADELMRGLDDIHAERSLTAAFLQFNHAIAAGNLLVEKRLWEELGGFREDSPDPAWDFCVRASLVEAPAILFEPKYTHRLRGGAHAEAQAERMRALWLAEVGRACADRPQALQRVFAARQLREWRLLEIGRGRELAPVTLLALAEDLIAARDAHD